MAYLVWPLIGLLVALLVAAGPRRASRFFGGPPLLIGVFGALVGGIVGDGLPAALAGEVTPASIVGALLGALIFIIAMPTAPVSRPPRLRDRPADEP